MLCCGCFRGTDILQPPLWLVSSPLFLYLYLATPFYFPRGCAHLYRLGGSAFGGRAERALICPFMGANALTTVHILALPLLSLG